MNNSATATDRILERDGLRYWSPGPVPGSVWAIDDAGNPVLRGNVDAKVALRAAELGDATRYDPTACVVYLYGRVFGIRTHWRDGQLLRRTEVVIPCSADSNHVPPRVLEAQHSPGAVSYGGHP